MSDISSTSHRKPVRWPWYKNWKSEDQNIIADIEMQISEMNRASTEGFANDQLKIFNDCNSLVDKCIETHCRLFGNRVFVRQSLFLITQNFILIMPRSRLPAAWWSIKQRIQTVHRSKDDLPIEPSTVKSVEDYFEEYKLKPEQGSGHTSSSGKEKAQPHDEMIARNLIKQVKFLTDDKVVAEYLAAMVLQRKTYLLCTIAVMLLVGSFIAYAVENSCASSLRNIVNCATTSDRHTLLSTVLAGALGAALSTIISPFTGASSVPLVRVALVRPVVGAIAGLLLFFAAGHAQVAKFQYPLLYATAILVGFSERAFTKALGTKADRISNEMSRALGHPTKVPK